MTVNPYTLPQRSLAYIEFTAHGDATEPEPISVALSHRKFDGS